MQVERLLSAFTEETRRILGDALVGVYLHGSYVLGCFNPEKSDIDLIIVVEDELSDKVKREYMDMVVRLNEEAPEKGIEMSIVRRAVCAPFIYPTLFELHFSVMHLNWYKTDPEDYIARMNGTDIDLAAHFTVIYNRGRTLFGEKIESVFAPVPKEQYMDSIRSDVENAEEDITDDTVYVTLSLCRVLAYKRDGIILSKAEGGKWGTDNLPSEFSKLIGQAVKKYTSGSDEAFDAEQAVQFAKYMLGEINR